MRVDCKCRPGWNNEGQRKPMVRQRKHILAPWILNLEVEHPTLDIVSLGGAQRAIAPLAKTLYKYVCTPRTE